MPLQRSTAARILALVLALGACTKPNERAPAPPRAARDGGASAAGDAAPPPTALVDLLHAVPAEVGVSSAVANAKDEPWHLVDGDPKTAWGSKTGDLVGAWIGVRVPEDAFVDHLELVVGFDREKDGLDLFTANHRITRVGVRKGDTYASGCGEVPPDLRDDEQVTLDGAQRGFQRIPVQKPGGVICTWVLATAPGTKTTWREVVASELRVMGRPGKARRGALDRSDVADRHIPAAFQPMPVRDGADVPLRSEDLELGASPYRGIAELCAAFSRAWTAAAKASSSTPWPAAPATVRCREVDLPVPFTPAPPFVSARAVEVKDGRRTRRLVVAETKEGMWLTPLVFAEQYYVESDERIQWLHHAVEALRVDSGQLVLVADYQHTSSSPSEYRVYPTLARGASWCGLASASLVCRTWHPDFSFPLAVKRKEGERDAKVVASLPWADEVPFAIDASGKLVRR